MRDSLADIFLTAGTAVRVAKNTIKLLDVVTLTVDIPEYNLWRGQVGTVVELLADGAAFEVEFSDRNGRTYESVGLHPQQIMVLYFEPASPDRKAEMVTAQASQKLADFI
ncbi:DUF4926 domain-containing protein [Microcoleus sp. N3A4]|uniref:DUF4926 domain-containing protein n=1 Tax=Microcoleus sp. N3A4 TaxID=3055379 RepID=UPI002FD55A97